MTVLLNKLISYLNLFSQQSIDYVIELEIKIFLTFNTIKNLFELKLYDFKIYINKRLIKSLIEQNDDLLEYQSFLQKEKNKMNHYNCILIIVQSTKSSRTGALYFLFQNSFVDYINLNGISKLI